MSQYIAAIATLAIVLSPLFIPIAVTIVHAVRDWRPTFPTINRARDGLVNGAAQLSVETA